MTRLIDHPPAMSNLSVLSTTLMSQATAVAFLRGLQEVGSLIDLH